MSTTNFNLPTGTAGLEETRQTLVKALQMIDAQLAVAQAIIPAFTAADEDKVLTVVVTEGVASLAFVTPE